MPKAYTQNTQSSVAALPRTRPPLTPEEIELRSLPFIFDDDGRITCYWLPPELLQTGDLANTAMAMLGKEFAIATIDHMRTYGDHGELLTAIARSMIETIGDSSLKEHGFTLMEIEFWSSIGEYVATGKISIGVGHGATVTFRDAPSGEADQA